jgi:phosphoribosylanthranilate isomerase
LTLETASAGAPGGSGVPNNWAAIRDCQNRGLFAGLPPIIVAGGLTSQTVSEIVRTIRPWAVDVSSGVEISPGRKSPDSIRSFIAAVRRADSLDAA